MRRPVSVWLLVVTFIVLALGGLSGAYGFLSDPSGTGMGMSQELEQLPVVIDRPRLDQAQSPDVYRA